MIIGFTGTRDGTTDAQYAALRHWLEHECGPPAEAHHGDCVGADKQFHGIVEGVWPGVVTVGHPPTSGAMRAYCKFNRELMPRPFLERDRAIAAACDVLLACPRTAEEEVRSGTWATVRHGRKLGKRVVLFLPDGSVREETAGAEPGDGKCRDCGGHGSLREGTFLICPGCGGRGTADGQWPKGAS